MIPASVVPALNTLLAGVTAAAPLASAPVATLGSLQQQARDLTVTINAALVLDDALVIAPVFADPLSFASSLTALSNVVVEQIELAELAALVGRAAVNIANAGA